MQGPELYLQRPSRDVPVRQQLLHASHQVVMVTHGRLRTTVGVVDDQHLTRGQLRHFLRGDTQQGGGSAGDILSLTKL